MRFVLPEVTLFLPGHALHGTSVEVRLDRGHLESMAPSGSSATLANTENIQVIEAARGCSIGPGWIEMRARATDPGLPHLEELSRLLQAGARGGFTQVGVLPSTQPAIDSVERMSYWRERSLGAAAGLLPIAALTRGCKGDEMTDYHQLIQAGAIALSDDMGVITDTHKLRIALQYAAQLGITVVVRAEDPYLNRGIVAHEGREAVLAGMAGIPAVSEVIAMDRLLRLAQDTGCRLHFSSISTLESVELLKRAKASGLPVTCDVTIAHLIWDDSTLSSYDSHYKTDPPLRDRATRDGLRTACLEGWIDAVSSDHRPIRPEGKDCEFPLAEPGMALIEVVYPLLKEALGSESDERILGLLSQGPRAIYGLERPRFEPGEKADYTLFEPQFRGQFDPDSWISSGAWAPLKGRNLVGKSRGIVREWEIRLF